jgi:hypothetical protein
MYDVQTCKELEVISNELLLIILGLRLCHISLFNTRGGETTFG